MYEYVDICIWDIFEQQMTFKHIVAHVYRDLY